MHSAIYAPFHTGLALGSALAYNVKSDLNWTMAPVAELVDATDSKSFSFAMKPLLTLKNKYKLAGGKLVENWWNISYNSLCWKS